MIRPLHYGHDDGPPLCGAAAPAVTLWRTMERAARGDLDTRRRIVRPCPHCCRVVCQPEPPADVVARLFGRRQQLTLPGIR